MKKPEHYATCVAHALHLRGIGEDNFENTTMRVYHRTTVAPNSIFKALRKDGIIIPAVTGQLLGAPQHAAVSVLLLSVSEDRNEVQLYNPLKDADESYPTSLFVDAWNATGGICTTAFPADDTFRPKLLDLTHIQLPDEMRELCEAMAENAHDAWALERQSEGWTWGPERNDSLLETPDMVPYAQLPESEKQYDRLLASDTLRLLMALGYTISR